MLGSVELALFYDVTITLDGQVNRVVAGKWTLGGNGSRRVGEFLVERGSAGRGLLRHFELVEPEGLSDEVQWHLYKTLTEKQLESQ